jgi:hypothetical protein
MRFYFGFCSDIVGGFEGHVQVMGMRDMLNVSIGFAGFSSNHIFKHVLLIHMCDTLSHPCHNLAGRR